VDLVPLRDVRRGAVPYNHIMTTPRKPDDDLAATLAARRELGPDYDAAFVEKVIERVEQTLDDRMSTHKRTQAQVDLQNARDDRKVTLTVACVSLGISIPLTAIAETEAGATGILIVWVGLVMINIAYALRGRRH
jgi:hypothetical protein